MEQEIQEAKSLYYSYKQYFSDYLPALTKLGLKVVMALLVFVGGRKVIQWFVSLQHGQPVRIMPGAHQMVAGRLAGGIGGMGAVRRGFRKQAVLPQGAVYFVRGNVVEAETLLLLPLQGTVIFQGGLEHGKGAHDIGGHEIPRIVNGTVHVGLRRQVHHPVRSVFPQGVPHQGGVPNVGVQEAVRRRVRRAVQGTDVAGISQGVNIQDFMAALKQQPDQIGADESGAPRNDNFHNTVFRERCGAIIQQRQGFSKQIRPCRREHGGMGAEKRGQEPRNRLAAQFPAEVDDVRIHGILLPGHGVQGGIAVLSVMVHHDLVDVPVVQGFHGAGGKAGAHQAVAGGGRAAALHMAHRGIRRR